MFTAGGAEGIVVQFNVWEQGRIDADALKERLSTLVTHALWDVVTELHFLPRELTIAESGNEIKTPRLSPLFSNFAIRLMKGTISLVPRHFYDRNILDHSNFPTYQNDCSQLLISKIKALLCRHWLGLV